MIRIFFFFRGSGDGRNESLDFRGRVVCSEVGCSNVSFRVRVGLGSGVRVFGRLGLGEGVRFYEVEKEDIFFSFGYF